MRTEEEILKDAPAGSPFSNSTMFEVWAANNCGRSSGCVHDDAWGSGPDGTSCPLIGAALLGKWPQEWPTIGGVPGECTEYEEVVAHATDDEPADENPDEGHGETWRPVETINGQEGLF